MYELSRVRLYSIGPAGARYADTVLDLRGVGETVPQPAPTQAEFFAEEPVGPPRRPAPAGVLFLENGGGKSVLLKLIFSVMLPGHRNTLGGASSGVLRKFLLADDCGHVALEWQHVLTGECVVVGKVSEWRGRQVSNDPRKFAEAWYSLRPGPGLSLDNLPVAEATAVRPSADGQSGARGRRRTMKGFRDALTEAGKTYPHLEVHWEETHERWTEHLGDLGLDPELFRYQREMNADEGEAAGLFAVKKDSDFTDLLLRAVTDTRDTDGLADLVGGFGNKLGRRAELIAERDFTAGSVELLGRIVEATGARTRAREIHTAAERRTRTLARRLSARGRQERVRAADLAHRVTVAADAVTRAGTAREHSALISAEIAYRHASLALAAAEKSAAAQKRELADARTLYAAWQAAEAALRHRAAADRVARVSAVIQEAERDAAPALAARAKAAVDLVRALHTAAQNAENLANEEEERSAALQEVSDTAHRDATAAATETQRARSEIGHLRQRPPRSSRRPRRQSGPAGSTTAPPTPTRPAPRLRPATRRRPRSPPGTRLVRRPTGRPSTRAKPPPSKPGRRLTAARAADAATAAGRAHEGELRTAQALAAEERPAELLGLPGTKSRPSVPRPRPDTDAEPGDGPVTEGALTATELDRFADDLRELLEEAVTSAERQLFELRTAAADDARILGALGDGGLLPPGPDVLATVELLGEHGIPALPGWRYLAQAVDPADHARVLAARPELVDGVVITDPESHTRARAALSDAALLPRSAVAVGTAAALLAPTPASGADTGDVFLVPPNPAMHDEHAADEERQTLRARATARDEEIRALAARLAKDRELTARLTSWRTGCPPGRLTELARAAHDARAFAEESEAELAEARTVPAEAEEAAAEAARVRDELQETAQKARRAADALAGLAFRLRERAGWQATLRELADDAAEAEARAQACLDRARTADEDRRGAQRAADDARRTARALRAERSEIAGAPDDVPDDAAGAGTEPSRISLPALREAYRAASQVYEKVGVGADLRAEQARAESDESAARAELDRLSNKVRNRAEQLLESPDGFGRSQPAGRRGPRRGTGAAPGDPDVERERAARATARRGRTAGARGGRAAHRAPRGHGAARRRARPGAVAHRHGRTGLPDGGTGQRQGDPRRSPRRAPRRRGRGRRLRRDRRHAPRPAAGTHLRGGTGAARALSRQPRGGPPVRRGGPQVAPRLRRRPVRRRVHGARGERHPCPARQLHTLRAGPHPRPAADPRASRLGTARARPEVGGRLRAQAPGAHRRTGTAGTQPRLDRGPAQRARRIGPRHSALRPAAVAAARRTRRVVGAGIPAYPLRGTRPGDPHRAARRGRRRGEPRGRPQELRPAPRRHVPAVARSRRRPPAEGHRRRDPSEPDAVLRAERVPVGQIGSVFSGGQLLTAAIALYCTMAALRSNDRGRDRHRHAGTLFLDNPIGRANATYLLELQRAVADALGVQLLYTTGLFDTTALAEFPLVIRLRNDADLRAGLK
ncbi:hypothetical protein SHIRM173S_04633 [Streptomyces hirsutus]